MIQLQKKREPVFDLIKALAIYLVVLGHTLQHFSPVDRNEILLYKFIYMFHMPLFMIVSGYFAPSAFRLAMVDFVKKKSVQLVLPVLTFALVMTLWFAFVEFGSKMNALSFMQSFLEQCNTWLWFLRCLFICNIILYAITRIATNVGMKWVLMLIVCIACFSVTYCNIGQMLPCFCLGILIKETGLICNKTYSETEKYIMGGVIFLLSLCYLSLSIENELMKRCLKLVTGCSLAVFIIKGLFSVRESRTIRKLSAQLSYVGMRTLEIYVMQCFVVEIFGPLLIKMPAWMTIHTGILHFVTFPILAVAFIIITLLIEKALSYIPMLHKGLFGK